MGEKIVSTYSKGGGWEEVFLERALDVELGTSAHVDSHKQKPETQDHHSTYQTIKPNNRVNSVANNRNRPFSELYSLLQTNAILRSIHFEGRNCQERVMLPLRIRGELVLDASICQHLLGYIPLDFPSIETAFDSHFCRKFNLEVLHFILKQCGFF